LLTEARKFEYGCLGIEEKKYIAKSYWGKGKGISDRTFNETVEITEPALEYLINHYTQEAGVNELKEVLKELGQKILLCKAAGLDFKNSLDKEEIRKLIGNGRYYFDDEISNNIPYGIGLAWTSKGGTLLPFELTVTPGNGRLSITGNVGKTMMESIQVVVQYMRYDSDRLGIEETYFDTHNLAVNIPEIALSKDGASAALAVFVLIYTFIKGKKLNRPAAVTGELSLTGKAIRVGGLKEKFNVAGCHHIKTVFLPKQSMDEYLRLPDCIKNQVEAIFVNDSMELIKRLEEDFFETTAKCNGK
jgi:ATP-dependent Lon protease